LRSRLIDGEKAELKIYLGFAGYPRLFLEQRLILEIVLGVLCACMMRLELLCVFQNYFLLIVGIGFLIASIFLWKSKRIGVYIGIISFGVAFAVNIYVAGNLFAHLLVGGFFGILLFLPLFFGWKSLT